MSTKYIPQLNIENVAGCLTATTHRPITTLNNLPTQISIAPQSTIWMQCPIPVKGVISTCRPSRKENKRGKLKPLFGSHRKCCCLFGIERGCKNPAYGEAGRWLSFLPRFEVKKSVLGYTCIFVPCFGGRPHYIIPVFSPRRFLAKTRGRHGPEHH